MFSLRFVSQLSLTSFFALLLPKPSASGYCEDGRFVQIEDRCYLPVNKADNFFNAVYHCSEMFSHVSDLNPTLLLHLKSLKGKEIWLPSHRQKPVIGEFSWNLYHNPAALVRDPFYLQIPSQYTHEWKCSFYDDSQKITMDTLCATKRHYICMTHANMPWQRSVFENNSPCHFTRNSWCIRRYRMSFIPANSKWICSHNEHLLTLKFNEWMLGVDMMNNLPTDAMITGLESGDSCMFIDLLRGSEVWTRCYTHGDFVYFCVFDMQNGNQSKIATDEEFMMVSEFSNLTWTKVILILCLSSGISIELVIMVFIANKLHKIEPNFREARNMCIFKPSRKSMSIRPTRVFY